MMRDSSRVFAMQPHANRETDDLLIEVGDSTLIPSARGSLGRGCHAIISAKI